MSETGQLARARHTRISSKHRTAQSETGVLTRAQTARPVPPVPDPDPVEEEV